MAHLSRPKGDPVKIPEGPARVEQIYSIINSMGEPHPGQFFYELEPAEVINVLLDADDLMGAKQTRPHPRNGENVPDWSKYGHIEARLVYSKESIEDIRIFAPMDSNIKEYPRPGEYVIIANYFGESYYTTKLNMFNSVNLNANPGISRLIDPIAIENYRIKEFIGNIKIREIMAREGDITFNGRFGQSIRFGSNITELNDADGNLIPDTGEPQSPNIKIRAGQGMVSRVANAPILENINLDGSSLYLTTNEVVGLNQYPSRVTDLDPKKFDGKQIVLNSDRLVFNSKGTDIFAYSSRDINLVSKNRIVLEGHNNVYLGTAPKQGETTGWTAPRKGPSSQNPNIQPALKGDETMDIIELLIDYLNEFAITIQSAHGSVVDFVVPISDIIDGASGLSGKLTELKKRLNDPKSDIVKVI